MAEVYLDVAYGKVHPCNTYDLYVPVNTKEPVPLLVWIHGGAWVSGDKAEFSQFAEKLACRGVATALLNYQLTPRPPADPGNLRHPIHIQDCISGLLHVLSDASKRNINPCKLFIGGHSAGGYMASSIALSASSFMPLQTHEHQALQNLKGVFITEGIFDLTEFVRDDPTYASNYILPAFGDAWKDASLQKILLSSEWRTWALKENLPFHLIHSLQDSLVSSSQSENFMHHLRSIGLKNVSYDLLELGDHDQAPQTDYVLQKIIQFVRCD